MNINYTCNEINDQFIIHCIALTFHTPFSPPQVEVWSLHHPAESIKYKSKKLIWFHIHKYKYVQSNQPQRVPTRNQVQQAILSVGYFDLIKQEDERKKKLKNSNQIIQFRTQTMYLKKFKLHLFYNDYETSYTTYINHTRWHRCLCLDGLRVGGNRSTWRKPTCLTW